MRFLANIKRTNDQTTSVPGPLPSTIFFAETTRTDRLLQHITGDLEFAEDECDNDEPAEPDNEEPAASGDTPSSPSALEA